MCVALSQKPMQSASVLPPPPGALGFDSLSDGDKARLLLRGTPPPPESSVGSGGAVGATFGTCGAGEPVDDAEGVAPVAEGEGADGPVAGEGVSVDGDVTPRPGRGVVRPAGLATVGRVTEPAAREPPCCCTLVTPS